MAGQILFEGKSLIDGAPIVVIATDSSKNVKTGGMVQTWIMRQDVAPHEALKTGQDVSVCGDCPHRPVNGGSCYVTVFQAPLAVWKAYKRGVYGLAAPGDYAGRMVRVGSYGDPAAVPFHVWEGFTAGAAGVTGYTHQWRNCQPELASVCMASCDRPEERQEAKDKGFRTFRVRLETEQVQGREVICPASAEGGHKVTCSQCKACNGNRTGRKGDIVIIAHGAVGKVNKYKAMRAA